MSPYFNTTGPCVSGEHYMLPPERRLGRVMRLVEEGRYFTLHAGRQTGKTTSARWLVDRYNEGEDRQAAWVDLQTAREQPEPARAFRTVLGELDRALARDLPDLARPGNFMPLLADPGTAVLRYLQAVSAQAPRPLVLLLDEADGLTGEAMVSFLTQLRSGYTDRSRSPFPRSLALIGVRRVRDYTLDLDRSNSSPRDRQVVSRLGTTSPFNITAEAPTLEHFSQPEVEELLLQHTAATGQRFEPNALARTFDLSQGHPWLVNALAYQVVSRDVEDRGEAVTAQHVEAARETIILERRTHIDSLVARLREPRVRRILEPMLTGGSFAPDGIEDDLQYVQGLGLIRLQGGAWRVANPIYREVIPRALTFATQTSLAQEAAWYVQPDGGLDVAALLTAFQEFWREDGHLAAEGFAYREAGPHLVLMAFLQRVVNSQGQLDREYGLGRGAIDLMIRWGTERHAVEIKLRRDKRTEQRGAEQIAGYLESAGLDEGWLVLFDLRKSVPWDDRLFLREIEARGKRIRVVGC